MATYGKGYFSDMSTLTIGIEEGLAEAFRLTCEQLLDDIRSWTDADIYSKPESDRYTPRTGEFREAWDYDIYTVTDGFQQADFVVRTDKIETRDNPFHTVIEDGGTGDDLKEILFAQTDNLKEDIEFWIRDNFQRIYRENCKALGIQIQG
jgi:hypothetical protein